jgi:hypothetical protein
LAAARDFHLRGLCQQTNEIMKTILIKGVAFEAHNGTMVNINAPNAQMGFIFSAWYLSTWLREYLK